MWILVLLLVLVVWWLVHKFFKIPTFGAVTMITGGVKCGKSALTVKFALREYKRAVFRFRIRKIFAKLFRRMIPERPLLYSNIPLCGVKYVPLTTDHLLRKLRFNYGSVVILDEVSLVADSMLARENRNSDVNLQLLLFCKLFGHETHGGKLFVNSHVISDVHYAFRRTTSTYYYIHHLSRFPFFSSFSLREERYSEDGTVQNTYDEDVQKSMLRILAFNRMYKRYDAFCYSVLTDKLPVQADSAIIRNTKYDSLKTDNIVSFRSELRNIHAFDPIDNKNTENKK